LHQARSGIIQDNKGRNIIENPKMDAMLRYRFMSHKLQNLAHRAANFPECTMLVDSTLDILGQQIEDKINAYTSTHEYLPTVSTDVSPPNEILSSACLKKKEVQTKSSKRKRTWLDKKHKAKKKRQNKATTQLAKEASNDAPQAQVAHISVVCC